MNLLLSVMETLRTTFKYTYLTDKDFAKHVDFPYTEEIDNDGKTYFLYDIGDKQIRLLTLSKAKEIMGYVKPQFYLPKTTAYMEHEKIHVVVNRRHIVLSTEPFTLRYILPRTEHDTFPKTILYDKYKLSRDTQFVAFYEPQDEETYCIPLTQAEIHLLSLLLDSPIKELPHIFRI